MIKRADIVRDCGVRAGRFDREHGNRMKTRDEFHNTVDDFLDGHSAAAATFDAHGWDFARLVSDSYQVYLRHYRATKTE